MTLRDKITKETLKACLYRSWQSPVAVAALAVLIYRYIRGDVILVPWNQAQGFYVPLICLMVSLELGYFLMYMIKGLEYDVSGVWPIVLFQTFTKGTVGLDRWIVIGLLLMGIIKGAALFWSFAKRQDGQKERLLGTLRSDALFVLLLAVWTVIGG